VRKRLAKAGLLVLNALVPVFIAACYGVEFMCLSGRVVDKSTGAGINGIRVSCLVSNGPMQFSIGDDLTSTASGENGYGDCGYSGDVDSDMDTDIDSDADTETGTETETDTDTETETGSDTDVDTDADVDAGDGDAGAQDDAGVAADAGATLLWESYSLPGDGYFEIRVDGHVSCQMLRFTDVDGAEHGSYKELTLWDTDFDGTAELERVE
jgi:hypothetical protein